MIPLELQAFRQWVIWRREWRPDATSPEGGKWTKVPYSPLTGYNASVKNPAHWGSFSDACLAAKLNNFDGIGFVLTHADPYAFVDLDEAKTQDEWDLQQRVFSRIVSYTEKSPSGHGLHIIAKGSLPDGKKKHSVEVYTAERFMTMTGDVFRDVPIVDAQDELRNLHEYLSSERTAHTHSTVDEPATETDVAVCTRAYNAVNGQKFLDLYEGRWQDYYPSQSEADVALINIVAFYTNNREQVRRIFLASNLGKRDKAHKHKTYVTQMVAWSFDRKVPSIDIEKLQASMNEALARERAERQLTPTEIAQAAERQPPETKYSFPPGLLGELCEFIFAAAPRPILEVALVSALGLMAGVCGRAYNVSGSGLNQYLLLVGVSGVGKEAITIGLDKISTELTGGANPMLPQAKTFFGPGEIASSQAIRKHLVENPSFVTVMGEIGHVLANMAKADPSPQHDELKRVLLQLYSKSGHGQILRETIRSDREKNTALIKSPSFTLIGETTFEVLYKHLDEAMVNQGFIPRFSIVEVPVYRPPSSLNQLDRPPVSLMNRLGPLAAHCLMMAQQDRVTNVQFTPEASKLLWRGGEFDVYCDRMWNEAERDVIRDLWNRAHLKAMKLAALIAVGNNYMNPVIDEIAANWAVDFVLLETRNMMGRFDAGDIVSGDVESQQIRRIVELFRDWLLMPWDQLKGTAPGMEKLYTAKIVPFGFISRKCANIGAFKAFGKTSNNVREAIRVLVERGDIAEIPKHKLASDFGISQVAYQVTNLKAFKL